MQGGEFAINTAKCCLLGLIKLQPGECLFQFLVESSFLIYTFSSQEPSLVQFAAVLLQSHCSFPLHKLWATTFLWKNYPNISVSDLYNKLVAECERATCKRCIKAVSRSPHPLQKPGYLEFCKMCIFGFV